MRVLACCLVPKKMPVRLIANDKWRLSTMMERRLWDLEKEGLLRPLASATWPEWVAPSVEHWEPSLPEGYVVSFVKFHHHGLGSSPSHFMRALLHHYDIELQHLSPNAVFTTAIFAAVCEGYLGVMSHWELWIHLFWGELFHAPGGAAGGRKPVQTGFLNLVQKMGQADEPREYIRTRLTSNHA